jgi:hypothetical protein
MAKKSPSFHIRPKKGETKEAFKKRFSEEMIAFARRYRKEHNLPVADDRKK